MTATLRGAENNADAMTVEGELNFTTVPALWRQAQTRLNFTERRTLALDLGAVTRADSAGVALLVDWLGQARKGGCELRFVNVPAQMRSIIEVSGLTELIPAPPTQ